MTIEQYATFVKNQLNLNIGVKFKKKKKINGPPRKLLDVFLAKYYG